ncbi:MAG: hypothetical protein IKX46_01230 [Verrucomicrobia bacterium]|nr:hypothetical protein [Verrucomicrobiota bacterium]
MTTTNKRIKKYKPGMITPEEIDAFTERLKKDKRLVSRFLKRIGVSRDKNGNIVVRPI